MNNPSVLSTVFVLIFCIYVLEGLNFSPAYAGVSVARERISQARLQQRLMGVWDVYYWIANFLFDFAIMLPILVIFFVIICFVKGLRSAVLPMTLEILLFFWAAIPLCYWCSFPYKTAATAESSLLNVMMVPMLLSALVSALFSFVPFLKEHQSLFGNILYLVPGYAIFDSFKNVASVVPIYAQYGLEPPSAWDWDYCGRAMVFLFVEGFVFFFCTIFSERRNWVKVGKVEFTPEEYKPEDEDVKNEIATVRASDCNNHAVTVTDVWKVYPGTKKTPPVEACRDVTFAVNEGDCFGLIGPNGAGKTSILSILVGTLGYNQGSCAVTGKPVPKDIIGAYKVLGYCPQFDVLFDFMTVYECLYFYGMVKGIPQAMLDQVVNTCLECLGLAEHRDKNTKDLSGGNKRRLCVAIAFMGNPRVVIMDEPSTGLDPVSRRKLWNIVKTSSKARSFLLTTHLMEEADALCNRIAIMVNGQIQCIGSGQHLKSKFGEGYTLDFKLEKNDEKMKEFMEFVKTEVGEYQTKEIHGCHAILVLPNTKPLSFLFKLMERSRDAYKIIDYTLSQTTLDQVFLQFAKNQREETLTLTQAELMKTNN